MTLAFLLVDPPVLHPNNGANLNVTLKNCFHCTQDYT